MADGPYTDTGTGNVPFKGVETTYTNDASQEPTGNVPFTGVEITYDSDPHDGPPTGAVEGPPESVTRYEWPAQPPDEPEPAPEPAPEPEPAEDDEKPAKPAKRAQARKRGS